MFSFSYLSVRTLQLDKKHDTLIPNALIKSNFARTLGASELLEREKLQGEPKPLARETYAGCVDSAGGHVLANILPLIKHSGTVACCGLAAGMPLNTTVAPFILR